MRTSTLFNGCKPHNIHRRYIVRSFHLLFNEEPLTIYCEEKGKKREFYSDNGNGVKNYDEDLSFQSWGIVTIFPNLIKI